MSMLFDKFVKKVIKISKYTTRIPQILIIPIYNKERKCRPQAPVRPKRAVGETAFSFIQQQISSSTIH